VSPLAACWPAAASALACKVKSDISSLSTQWEGWRWISLASIYHRPMESGQVNIATICRADIQPLKHCLTVNINAFFAQEKFLSRLGYVKEIRERAKSLSFGFPSFSCFKPWPNGLASRRRLKTCVYLRRIAITCVHFGRDQICTKLDARFSPFGHPNHVNSSRLTSIRCYSNLLTNEILSP